jgi:methyltransferase (TIGR00027 family)
VSPKVHSRTAEITAAIRAGHLLYDKPILFEDPYALALTSSMWRAVCRVRFLHRLIVGRLLGALRPVHGWILVRDLLTEQKLKDFASAGQRQFVLLGAGFDSTALRRPPWLADVHIVEVDHPATQAVKLARIARIARLADVPRLDKFETIALDFEQENLVSGLERSALNAGLPTLFAWQGVIYYLSETAIRETLQSISQLACAGSELIFDFLLPDDTLAADDSRVKGLAGVVTARMGERYISFHTAASITALLERVDFEILEIALDHDLQARHFAGRNDDLSAMRGFGIVHARKRG